MKPACVSMLLLVACVALNACTANPTETSEVVGLPADLAEVFPHVRISSSQRVVEFDGIVPLDAHDDETPIVYLELVACTPDTREYESLVMTRAKPSHIHAAMLLVGFVPGEPGRWRPVDGGYEAVAPTGDALRVTIAYETSDGSDLAAPAESWITDLKTGSVFSGSGWVFAGSREVEFRGQAFYDADGAGTLVGLTTFGSEVIAWGEVYSHVADVLEPSWIANAEVVPAMGTPVRVRIGRAD